MNQQLKTLCERLENDIKRSYEDAITIDEAEKLAAKFLHAQLKIAIELRNIDLDARMKKSGLKAVKAAVYMESAKATEKKPSDVLLNNIVDQHELVQSSQNGFDEAEVERDLLQNYFNTFREAHVYYRGIAKGRFE